jgi:Fe-S-cluster-containing hydrogenase component 2
MELFGLLEGLEGKPPSDNTVVMVIDLKRCLGCFSCETSCKMEHDLSLGPRLIRVMQVGPKTVKGRVRTLYIPMLCYHCNPAPCMPACPTAAIQKRPQDGIVWIEAEKCIGCRQCMQACPYGAIQYDTRTGKAIKCDFCKHRVDYRKKYTKDEIEQIYRHILQNGGSLRTVVFDEQGNVKRDNKGRLVDEKGEPLSGRKLAEKIEVPEELMYYGLWSSCSTKCSTECMTFGYYRDLKAYLDELGKKRDVQRIGSIFYALPKDDFPVPRRG